MIIEGRIGSPSSTALKVTPNTGTRLLNTEVRAAPSTCKPWAYQTNASAVPPAPKKKMLAQTSHPTWSSCQCAHSAGVPSDSISAPHNAVTVVIASGDGAPSPRSAKRLMMV